MQPMSFGVDTNVIMQGKQADLGNALAVGLKAGGDMADQMHTGAYRAALQEHGAGALAGDKAAQNALAGFDPAAMQSLQSGALGMDATRLGMDQTRLSMDATRQQMRVLDETTAAAAREEARKLSDAERAKQLAGVEKSIKMMSAYNDAASWDAAAAQIAPDLVGKFDQKQSLIYSLMDAKDILTGAKPQSSQGKFYADQAGGLIPADATFKGDNATTVQIGVDGEGRIGGNSSKFNEEIDKKMAQQYADGMLSGKSSAELAGDLQALSDLALNIGTGSWAQAKEKVGPMIEALGIKVDGLSDIQLFQAIVDRVSPQMRPAGSGAGSDFDAKQFLNSLPNLSKTVEGNQLISETFGAVLEHRQKVGQIMRKGIASNKHWTAIEEEIESLPNPYEGFNKKKDRIKGGSGYADAPKGGAAPVADAAPPPAAPVGNALASPAPVAPAQPPAVSPVAAPPPVAPARSSVPMAAAPLQSMWGMYNDAMQRREALAAERAGGQPRAAAPAPAGSPAGGYAPSAQEAGVKNRWLGR